MNRSRTFVECFGPATVALECSLKRQRTPEKAADVTFDSIFDFDSVFDSIAEESFPSLSWPLADEENYFLSEPMDSRKRIRSDMPSGLKRTKALSSDLSTLNATATITKISPLNKIAQLADHKLPSHSRQQLPFSTIVTSVNMARCC